MLIYDYETFKKNVLLGVLNEQTGEIFQSWDIREIIDFTKKNLENVWVGYNCEHYDKPILHGMLTGKLTTEDKIFEFSNSIIRAQDADTPLFGILKKYRIDDYYSSPILSYDVMGDGCFMSLKQNEGFMGMDIVESVVPFDLDRELTPEEKEDVAKYNRADLYGTLERFKQRKNTFKTKMMLVKEFGLPRDYMCKTNAKLTEAILLSQNKGVNARLRKHFDLCELPVNWEIPQLKQIYNFFCEALKELEINKWETKKCDKKKLSMNLDILGVEHTFALGGVHGGIKNYICRPEDKKKIIWVDVSSLYPNILTKWDLLSRKVDQNGVKAFANMVQVRMDIKSKLHDESLSKEEKSALKDQAARYKLILNTTSGCMKDKFKKIYDPEFNTKMCMLGQLSLMDLVYRLALAKPRARLKPSWATIDGKGGELTDGGYYEYFKLIQSNTDGIALELLSDDAESIIDDVCKGWEKDWRFSLEKTVADNLYEKDVNNYVFKDSSGKIKVKGAYVTKYDDNEQDTLAILAKAVVDYFLEGVDIRTTICNPENLATDYQMIKKLGGMYDTPTWKREYGDEEVQKVNRIFPSTDLKNGGLYKHKKSKDVGVLDKVEGTPEHVLIMNTDIRGKKIGELDNIDYEWYIAEAQKRINDFLRNKTRKENKKKEGNRVMRDPNRIPEVLKELEEFWKQVPDWRLGQVISNFSYELTGNNDPFYMEDKDLLEMLRLKNTKECICKNCGKTFTTYSRINRYYCDNPSPQDPKKTCAEIGPKLVYQQRYHDEDDWYSWYRKTYQMVQGRVRRNPEKYESKLFEDFRQDTRQWIEDVKKGRKASSEFIQWLKQYREKLHMKETKHKKEESKKLSYEDKIMSELTEKDLEV